VKILVINCGSSSSKYRLFDIKSKKKCFLLSKGIVEKIGHKNSLFSHSAGTGDSFKDKRVKASNHEESIRLIIQTLCENEKYRVLSSKAEIDAVGHRVVHGASEFKESTLISRKVIKSIRKNFRIAPLHNPPNLEGILTISKILPGRRQVAVFDTAFHQTLPEWAYLYGLPFRYYQKHNIRRYGFHGTSHRYVAKKAEEALNRPQSRLKLITCHLGNGCSITAVKNGKSVDTSMGFTPLEGLLMGTRCGDIDPAILLYIMNKERRTTTQMKKLLNEESGLKGLSGFSNDMRDILKAKKEGNKQAQLAFSVFCYRIKKYIGAYAAVMGGVDAIIFTAGIGENVKQVRGEATKGLSKLLGKKVKILSIPTDEELLIAQDTFDLVRKK
jgi:acetate kinase